jgi:hypothetical protein
MPTTYSDANDNINLIAYTIWQQANPIFGYIPELRFQGVELPTKPAADKVWGRVSQQIIEDKQSSLANKNGQRLYHAKGLLFIQIFVPRTNPDSSLGRRFAQLVREAFRTESQDGQIWFTNQRILELPPTSENYPITVSVHFEYDNINAEVNLVLPGTGSKHFPVEAIDGVRTLFTFVGIPSDNTLYLIFWNGLEQDGLAQVGSQINTGTAPKVSDTLVAVY